MAFDKARQPDPARREPFDLFTPADKRDSVAGKPVESGSPAKDTSTPVSDEPSATNGKRPGVNGAGSATNGKPPTNGSHPKTNGDSFWAAIASRGTATDEKPGADSGSSPSKPSAAEEKEKSSATERSAVKAGSPEASVAKAGSTEGSAGTAGSAREQSATHRRPDADAPTSVIPITSSAGAPLTGPRRAPGQFGTSTDEWDAQPTAVMPAVSPAAATIGLPPVPGQSAEADAATARANRKLAWVLAGVVALAGGLLIGTLRSNLPSDLPAPALAPPPVAGLSTPAAQPPTEPTPEAVAVPPPTTEPAPVAAPPPTTRKVAPASKPVVRQTVRPRTQSPTPRPATKPTQTTKEKKPETPGNNNDNKRDDDKKKQERG